jgi:FkbM family methyltransferase
MVDFRNYEYNGIKLYHSDIKIETLKNYLINPKIIFEFGSYDGGDGCFYKQNFPNSRVISIEASIERFNIIKSYEKILGIEIFNYAISNINGFDKFYEVFDPNVMDSNNNIGSSGSLNRKTEKYKNSFKHLKELEPIEVQTIRIDTFCQNNNITEIDFMHIDVEGTEHKVLDGFGEIRPKIIWAETYLGKDYYGDNAYDSEELIKLFIEKGYEIIEKSGADTLFLYNK